GFSPGLLDKRVEIASASEDGREGTAARLEKRTPVFKGR
ncbi:MAG TPA: 2,3-dehydroadipyl-CoA hydratase, partial [Porticoccaceae bacterium]|nr:2,3-dehydroadipyl-CoA hydratase [Porticoccaceae bacterium]